MTRERSRHPGIVIDMEAMRAALEKIAKKGFFHIFGASTINKVLSALLGIALVWVMSKEDYGVWSYANNIVGFFVLLNGLGAPSALLQLCSEHFGNVDLSRSFYAYGAKAALLFDIAMCLLIAIVGIVVPLPVEGSNALLTLYCFYPLVILLCDLRLTWLRTRRENKTFALMTNIQTMLLVAFSLLGALLFSAVGLIVGQYIAYIATFIIFFFKGDQPTREEKEELSTEERRDYWSVAPISAINIGFSQILTLLGTFLVGIFMTDATDVANYKVATTIPFALMFMPGAVMTFVYPYFAEKRSDGAWTRKRCGQLVVCSLIFFGSLALVFIIIGNPLILFLFGQDYEAAVSPYAILMLGFFINASLRVPVGNLLVTQRQFTWNMIINAAAVAANLIVSYLLIPMIGLCGASWAYVASMVTAAILSTMRYAWVIHRL